HAFVRHPRSDARHQTVVIDPVEKFFEIKIDHDRVARSDVLLCLSHRLVGGLVRGKGIAVLGERWVRPLLENLQQGLLDQSIDDARDAELSDPAIRLGDFGPLDRLRLVGSREQLRPDVWPVLTQVGLGALDGHPIDARATSVTANSFPRSYEVSSVAHLLHQLFCAGRAFGCGLRHGWFGPLVSAARGFTPAFWDQGQRVLDFLPRSTHELPVLLATLNRSGLRSSFPVRPICCSAFRPWSASLALPTAGPNMPSADFCSAVRRPYGRLSRLWATRSRPPGVSSIASIRRSADGVRHCRCRDHEPAAKRSTCWSTAQGSSSAVPVSGWSRSTPQRCVGPGESSISGWTPTQESSLPPSRPARRTVAARRAVPCWSRLRARLRRLLAMGRTIGTMSTVRSANVIRMRRSLCRRVRARCQVQRQRSRRPSATGTCS